MKYEATSLISSTIDEPRRVTDSDEVAEIVRELVGKQMSLKEHFCIITLNGNSSVIRSECIHIGTANQSLVHPREVFRPAIIDNAVGIIISHNHPSGTLEASRADIQITQRLKEVSKLVGVELLDHVIVTASGHYSFSDKGLI